MNTTHALNLVRDIHFMPTWEISAERGVGTDHIDMYADFEAYNSNRDMALRGYPSKIQAGRPGIVRIADIETDLDLYRRVITELIKPAFEHEIREFFRVGNDMRAPFHPHHVEGMRNWGDATPANLADLERQAEARREAEARNSMFASIFGL